MQFQDIKSHEDNTREATSATLLSSVGKDARNTCRNFSQTGKVLEKALLFLFFYGELARGKYGGVYHVDAEKEQQCLAAGVACRYTADAIVLFMIAEAALHGGRAQCPDYSPGCAYVSIFILGLRPFADKTGCYAVFGTVPPVIIVGIDGVSADPGDIDACQFLLIFNAFP